MSGKDRKRQTTQRRALEPFDLARLAAGEARAVVYLDDGSRVEGRLDMTWMIVPLGPSQAVSHTAGAVRRRSRLHSTRVMCTGQLSAKGLTDAEIVGELMRLGLIADSDDPGLADRIRSVKRWQRAFQDIPPQFQNFPPGTVIWKKSRPG